VLLVSHVLSEVEQTCEAVAVVVGGKLVKQGPLADLTRDRKTGEARPLEAVLQGIYESAQT
jgi:ABC-type multidrug transport system ATPase subunit